MDQIVRFTCGACGKALKAKAALAGRAVRCPCGQTARVPGQPPAKGTGAAPVAKKAVPASGLPAEKALSIVQECKDCYKKRGTYERVGSLNPKHLANARASYAQAMGDDEVPLTMLDGSFLQNGSSGVLITNCRLYSSDLTRPVPLARIEEARAEKPTTFDYWMSFLFGVLYGPLKAKLVVNRDVVFAARMSTWWKLWAPEFWAELLTNLARVCRGQGGG